MNVLMDSYASEDEGSDDGRHSDYQSNWSRGYQNRKNVAISKQDDVNYEEVQMDLSEDSDDSGSEGLPVLPKDRGGAHKEDVYRSTRDQTDTRDREDARHKKDERTKLDDRVKPDNRTRVEERNREERSDRDRSRTEERSRSDDCLQSNDRTRGERFKDDDRHTSKSEKDDNRDRRDRDRREDKDRYSRDDERDRYRDRRDRDGRDRRSRRSSSRDRKRGSRSPKYERASRRSRSRSRSRERYSRGYNKRGAERPPKVNIYERPDLQRSMEEPKPVDMTNKDNKFFIHGITGRFKDQIEKRKLLWQKKEPAQETVTVAAKPAAQGFSTSGAGGGARGGAGGGAGSRITKVWEATTFAQDNDGKVASKFKRLMGIRNPEATDTNKPAVDVLKRQEEMFSSMEQQYEVARTATHTMRGVGLGFGSFQR